METKILRVNPQEPEADKIAQAAEALRAGELVAFPTETVYGLGANALDPQATTRIFAAKERPPTNPLIVHLASKNELPQVATNIPEAAWRLIDAFWPGALTLILPRQPSVPLNVTAGLETVAVRMPSHPVAHALIEAAGVPVAAPSANRYTRPSPTTAQHVLEDLGGRVAIILDGGSATIGVESTVLDLAGQVPQILRPGGVSLEELRRVLPEVVQEGPVVQSEGARRSPGLHLKHYSPRARLICFLGEGEPLYHALDKALRKYLAQGERVILLLPDEDAQLFRRLYIDDEPRIISLGSRENLSQIAHNLFAALREADNEDADIILTRGYPSAGIGTALNDRLMRAAEGNVRAIGDDVQS